LAGSDKKGRPWALHRGRLRDSGALICNGTISAQGKPFLVLVD
jgi:hypothetical protein